VKVKVPVVPSFEVDSSAANFFAALLTHWINLSESNLGLLAAAL
jgi:hypothetical protein